MRTSDLAPDHATAEIVSPIEKRSNTSAAIRYLRNSPGSAVLAALILVTGMGFGVFWGGFPDDFAAGFSTTMQQGRWWTLATALVIPSSIANAIIAIGLVLTAGAYAERRLGPVVTILLFFCTGIIGILVGIGLQELALVWGSDWGLLRSGDLTLDPTIGVVGIAIAATATLPALWRRRIRVIGFVLLGMFAIYAGDSASTFRLLAGVAGLIAGIVIARQRPQGTWYRSSHREVRTLVAAIVAATGLGPIVVLISGALEAPLGLVVAGFVPISDADVETRCEGEMTDACAQAIDATVTAGMGPFLISLVPLLLALLAAWGLRTGRRAAWILAITTNVAVAFLTGAVLGVGQLFDFHVLNTVGPQLAISVVLATSVPIAVVILLVATRHRFRVRAPRSAVVQFVITVALAAIVLGSFYIIIGVLNGDDYLAGPPSLGAVFSDVLRPFVPAGFLPAVTLNAVPVSGLALATYQWVGVTFWLIFAVATVLLYRATSVGRTPEEGVHFRRLLKAGAGGTLGFMGTWAGNSYWFTQDGNGAVAYRVINKIALTMSDPLCAAGDERSTIEGFVQYCESQGWTACFYSFHERYLPVFDSFGWQHMSVGEETVLDLPGLEMAGKPWQKIRQALNKGQREGITTLWSTWNDLPPALAMQIEAISEEWVANKTLPEMGFTLGGMEELKDPDVALYLAIDNEGVIQATTSWLPSWTDGKVTGWTIDFMRRGDDAMAGIMEFIIASAALHMKDQGVQVMSLSGAPLATKPGGGAEDSMFINRLLTWLSEMLEPAYGFTSLFRFKSKFNPRYDTIYMAYADPAQLPAIGLAIGNAYLPDSSPREYLALVQAIRGRTSEARE